MDAEPAAGAVVAAAAEPQGTAQLWREPAVSVATVPVTVTNAGADVVIGSLETPTLVAGSVGGHTSCLDPLLVCLPIAKLTRGCDGNGSGCAAGTGGCIGGVGTIGFPFTRT